jgi:adenylosuccinate lyase
MIDRYTRPLMGKIWSDENRLAKWLAVELTLLEVLVECGIIPSDCLKQIHDKAEVSIQRMREIESTVQHDVIAFITALSESLGEAGRWVHFGLTSSDVVDTAFAMQLKDSVDALLGELHSLITTLSTLADRHRHTVMMGRTHGMHAEPITFGLKCAGWYAEMRRAQGRLERAREEICYGKLSGAVGIYSIHFPTLEERVLTRLGLKPEPVATQVVPRDRHAALLGSLALLGGSLERIATEVRHLHRTELGEALEPLDWEQLGSSAMPHKRNPWMSENVCGLARLLRAYAGAALENIALWHERDISHSSVERVVAPDAFCVADFMINRVNLILSRLEVRPDAMKRQVDKTGAVALSEHVLSELVRRGVQRKDAYAWVRECTFAGQDFKSALKADPRVSEYLTPAEIDDLLDVSRHLRHVDTIINRALNYH